MPTGTTIEPAAAVSPAEAGLWNRDEALARVSGDQELLQQLIGLFRGEAPKLLSELSDALAHGDADTVRRVAHTLKSNVGMFGAKTAYDAALRVEKLAKEGDLTDTEPAIRALQELVQQLVKALAAAPEEVGQT